jgi:hypothetical protein
LATAAIALLFLLMVAAPCLIAMTVARHNFSFDELEAGSQDAGNVPAAVVSHVSVATVKPLTLQELAAQAERDALVAQDYARQAHWAALAAAAKAASLRADAAVEAATVAGRVADDAIRAAQAGFEPRYLPGDHPSLDFPRSRVRRNAA